MWCDGRRCSGAGEAQLQAGVQKQQDLEREYGSLARPTHVVSLSGFSTGGAADQWRRQNGLVGARTFGEAELQRLALGPSGLAC